MKTRCAIAVVFLLSVVLYFCLVFQSHGRQAFTPLRPFIPTVVSVSPFNPTNDVHLQLHLSVYDKLTNTFSMSPPTNNSQIAAWGDIGPQLTNTFDSGLSYYPKYYDTGGPTNGPSLSFAESYSVQLQIVRDNTFLHVTNQPATVYMLFNVTDRNPNGKQYFQDAQAGSTPPTNCISIIHDDWTNTISLMAGSGELISTNTIGLNTWALLTAQVNGSNSLIRINTKPDAVGFCGTNGLWGIKLGGIIGASGYFMIGRINEYLYYNDAHDSNQMWIVENYVTNKYLLTFPSTSCSTLAEGKETPTSNYSMQGGEKYLATPFTASSTYTTCSAVLNMWAAASLTNLDMSTAVYSDLGGVPGGAVGTFSDTINATNLPPAGQAITFTNMLDSLTASTPYWLVLKTSQAPDGGHQIRITEHSATGKALLKSTDGTTWTIADTNFTGWYVLYKNCQY